MSNQFRLLLFIVVISGALCTVEDYVIMSQCAHNKAIHVAAEGTVSVTDISRTQNITIVGLPDYVNNNLKIALYAKETQRYLCFNDQWKLVGMKELRDTCYFNETIVHGYFVFRSVVDLQRRVGFTHRGKAVGPKKNVNDACYLFTKIQADQFFHQHTDYFAPKSKSTKIISGIGTAPQTTTTATHTTSRAAARLASQRAATTATVTATAAQRNNNRLLRNNNNKNKRVNGMRGGNNNRSSNSNQNEEYTNGHSSNLSNSSSNNNSKPNNNQSVNNNHNNSNLVSNSQQQQQQVDLSQQQQHNNNSNGRTREHVRQQQQHQVRHHHNDPNLIARRQQHEHKQKRRQHQRQQQQQRLRSGRITSPATTTAAQNAAQERASASTTTKALYSTTATAAVARGSTQQEQGMRHEPQAATVANVAAKAATATAIFMKSTTTIANKRKGRRRKGQRKQRKLQQQQQQQQRAQQQLLALAAQEPAPAAVTPTQTTWLWSDSPTPPLASLSTQTLADVPSSMPTATTYGDYSGEWQSSVPTYDGATSLEPGAHSSLTPTLPTVASDTPTQTYTASTTDLGDSASSLTPTSDYNNNTELTSDALADEESLNATFITEFDDSRTSPEPTVPADEQLNSITSQQQHFTTQNVATTVSAAESIAPTSTTWSESSEHSWSPTTTTNETDDSEPMFPSPTAMFDAESVAATAIFSEDSNATEREESQTGAEDVDATINSTSIEIEAESSSSSSTTTNNKDDGFTEALAEVAGTQSTTTAHHNVYQLPAEREHIGHMWQKQSGIAASIASLLHKQLLTTSASSDNAYAWRPQRADEYSDEIIVATGRPVAPAELETTTDIAAGDRATWWQQHMNHSGTNFWDKGIAEEVPSSDDDADLDWLRHFNKHRNASKRRHNSRKVNSSNNSRDVEAVSQQPLQALLTSDSGLSFSKKYLTEGKLQRQSSKTVAGNNKLLAATTTAHEYSSTVATARASSATTHTEGVINHAATTTTTMSDKTVATATSAQQLHPLQQLLGNKTLLPLHNQPSLAHFDGNSNHLAHTHPPTATTLITTTSAAAAAVPTSTTAGGDATTSVAALTTKKSVRISTQKLLATPFHQLTYVRNNAGDIDIDNIDNISVYPDLLEESGELADQHSTERAEPDATRNSRLTIVSGYLPTSATATLPESIRLAKVKINKERKRMMSMRKRHTRRYA